MEVGSPWAGEAAPDALEHRDVGPSLGAPLLSFVLPGAGQHVLGQRRKWAYAVLEMVAWATYFDRRAAGRDYRHRYRDFAWDAARLQNGARVDGDFAYYEAMSRWERSGGFDTDSATSGIQPELDASTYNGWIWSLASGLFLGGGRQVSESDPAYQAALAYYEQRAYDQAMLWDWTVGLSGGRAELARLIRASDARFRQAATVLGVVIANHLLSAADAFLSARGGAAGARVRVVLDPGGSVSWVAQVPAGMVR
jgi:hypothetical protein